MTAPGTVYLVGAGPGDPGLITVRGVQCLQQADVVVYDRLSNARLLDYAPDSAQRVLMGKDPETPGEFQQVINQSLVQAAHDGKTVVRLKGGDPFVFGRGGEEVQALQAAGVPFEVVPGVTSAVAVPAYAGIPVTHRGIATAFTVVSGSEDAAKPEPALDWRALAATPGTLVVLMGWRSIPKIIGALLEHGRSPDIPAAIIQWGTTPQQRTVTGTLADIVQRGQEAGLTSPVVTVIGGVAGLHETMRWFDTRPLFGQRVLVTRSRTQASALSHRLVAQGAEPVELPTIEIAPLDDYGALDAALASLYHYQWLVFTSANVVEAAFTRLRENGRDARWLGTVKVAAIGPATAEALMERGVTADFVPDTFTSEATAEGFQQFHMQGCRVLLPRADIGTETLPDGLAAQGALVDQVTAYRTMIPSTSTDQARELLASGTIDAITFTSSSTVRNLMKLLDGDAALLDRMLVASIGPVTSATAREMGLVVGLEATEHTIPGLVQALTKHYASARASQGAKRETYA
jgi:uroporphyrinogen III methyltransferase/synthase